MIRPASDDGRLQVVSKATRFNVYRGNLHLVLTPDSSRVSVVDDVTLDAYLGGVVPVEMPPTWPAAALQAQAVAARSFAARRLHPATSFYDVPDTSASQIYRGVLAEKPQTNAAIAATAGQVLMSGSSIINALFNSTGGGATESNENVYTTATGRVVARPRELPARLERSGAGRDGLRLELAVRHLVDADVRAEPAVGLVRRRQPGPTSVTSSHSTSTTAASPAG